MSREPTDVRAQLLATEHWSLLASRSSTQSEVLSRIQMFLTFVSAGLVSLALVGQATDFSGTFSIFAIALLAVMLLVGVLTQVRVLNAGVDDAMYLLAMNRLRAAYVELEPTIAPYLLASTHDDMAGLSRSYYFLGRRSDLSQLAGSSMIFSIVVNSVVFGLLAAALANLGSGSSAVLVGVGAAAAVAFILASLLLGRRGLLDLLSAHRSLNPTPQDDPE